MPRGPFTWQPSYRKWGTVLDTATRVAKGGSFAPPSWYYAARRNPPRVLYNVSQKPPTVVFPEERLEGAILRRKPLLRLERADPLDMFCVPIRTRWAQEQLKLMEKGGMDEEEAFQMCEKQFAREYRKLKALLVRTEGKGAGVPLHWSTDAVLNVMSERRKRIGYIRDVTHRMKYRRARIRTVAEAVLDDLARVEHDSPIAQYGEFVEGKSEYSSNENPSDLALELIKWNKSANFWEVTLKPGARPPNIVSGGERKKTPRSSG